MKAPLPLHSLYRWLGQPMHNESHPGHAQKASPDVNGCCVLEAGQEQLGCPVPPRDHILCHEIPLRAAQAQAIREVLRLAGNERLHHCHPLAFFTEWPLYIPRWLNTAGEWGSTGSSSQARLRIQVV